MRNLFVVLVTLILACAAYVVTAAAQQQVPPASIISEFDASFWWIIGAVILVGIAAIVVIKTHSGKKAVEDAHAGVVKERNALEKELMDLKSSAGGEIEKFKHFFENPKPAVVPTAARESTAQSVQPTLAQIYIDRDDFMKAIGSDFPLPVMLDGKLVHNGMGVPLEYTLDAANGQISLKGQSPPTANP